MSESESRSSHEYNKLGGKIWKRVENVDRVEAFGENSFPISLLISVFIELGFFCFGLVPFSIIDSIVILTKG